MGPPPRSVDRHRSRGHRWDVGIVTATTERKLNPDDAALLSSLRHRGLSVQRVAWDGRGVRWSDHRLLVVRSTWNYHRQRDRFLRWASRAAEATSLWNPFPTLRWNTHKSYLRDLEGRGVPIVPTLWLRKGGKGDLGRLLQRPGWDRLVVKPVVSANARDTFVVTDGTLRRGQARLSRLLARESMMVQPYQTSVESVGERSLVFLDGTYSHAVRKPPVLVHRPSRYFATPVRADRSQRALARSALAACLEPTLYARVDMIQDEEGTWRIGEVELTEPYLFLGTHVGAADALAAAIQRRLP